MNENLISVDIEEYSDNYRDQVKSLIHNVYELERGMHSKSGRPDLDAIKEIYQENNGNFWIAVKDGKVIGTIGLINQGENRASMHRFCVDKDFRGRDKGVSAKLYSTFLGFARSHSYKKIFLGTAFNAKAAIKFYERNGFVKIISLPEDIAKNSRLLHDELFYELDL